MDDRDHKDLAAANRVHDHIRKALQHSVSDADVLRKLDPKPVPLALIPGHGLIEVGLGLGVDPQSAQAVRGSLSRVLGWKPGADDLPVLSRFLATQCTASPALDFDGPGPLRTRGLPYARDQQLRQLDPLLFGELHRFFQ